MQLPPPAGRFGEAFMETTVHCPSCGARTTAEPRDFEMPGFVICPVCQQPIPLQHGAEGEPRKPAD